MHNAYLDEDTTITSRVYAGYHRRDRYQLVSADSEPSGSRAMPPVVEDRTRGIERPDELYLGEDTMFGRLRTFRHVGTEVRGEWANQNLLGLKQDFQAGIRYEYQDMTNKNVLGFEDEIMKNGNKGVARSSTARSVPIRFLPSCRPTFTSASDFNVLSRRSLRVVRRQTAQAASSPRRRARPAKKSRAR